MPHCIIEYTSELEPALDIRGLVNMSFAGIEETGLFDPTAIKVRATKVEYYKSGLDRDDFIHLTVKILPGRTDEQKQIITESVLAKVAPIVGNTKCTSVEVVDLHGPSYNKRIK